MALFDAADYAPAFSGEFAGRDGFLYAVHLDRLNYGGAAGPLRVVEASNRQAVEGDGTDAGGCLAPLMTATFRVTMLDDTRGALAALAGARPGEWRLRVYDDSGTPGTADVPYGTYYVLPQTIEEATFDAAPAVTFVVTDGLGLLREVERTAQPASSLALNWLMRALCGLSGGDDAGAPYAFGAGAWDRLVTSVDWRPLLPGGGTDQMPYADDPLEKVIVGQAPFFDGRGDPALDELEALRAIAARFGARLFQSGGALYFVQRAGLAQGAGYANVSVHYGGSTDARASVSFIRDVRPGQLGEAVRGGYDRIARLTAPPVRSVGSAYAFDRDDANLIWNDSFEAQGAEAGGTAGTTSDDAAYWQHVPTSGVGNKRQDLTGLLAGAGLAANDHYALAIGGYEDTETELAGWQRLVTYLPPAPDRLLTVSASQFVKVGNAGQWGGPRGLTMEITDGSGAATWVASVGAVTTAADALPGEDVRLYVGELENDGGAVAGTAGGLVAPAGAALWFVEPGGPAATFTLREDFEFDDSILRGDLRLMPGFTEADIRAGSLVLVVFWRVPPLLVVKGDLTMGGYLPGDETAQNAIIPADLAVGGRDVDGGTVAGWLSLHLHGPVNDATGIGTINRSFWDDVRVADGLDPRRVYVATAPDGTPGADLALPVGAAEHRMGDGPTPDAQGAMYAVTPTGGLVPTQRSGGTITGWKRGVFTGTTPVSTELTIDALQAEEALRMLAGHAERWSGVFRPWRVPLRPHEALTVVQATTLAEAVTAGDDAVVLYARPEPGLTVVMDPAGAAPETFTVGDVAPNADGTWTAERASGTFAGGYAAGAVARYDLRVWADVFDHDLVNGTYAVDGTRLVWDDDLTVTHSITTER